LQDPLKFTQIWIFGLKTNHLATLFTYTFIAEPSSNLHQRTHPKTTVGQTAFEQTFKILFGQTAFEQTFKIMFGQTAFEQTFKILFGQTAFEQTFKILFGQTAFEQTFKALLVQTEVKTSNLFYLTMSSVRSVCGMNSIGRYKSM
jgi:hypothetical protein